MIQRILKAQLKKNLQTCGVSRTFRFVFVAPPLLVRRRARPGPRAHARASWARALASSLPPPGRGRPRSPSPRGIGTKASHSGRQVDLVEGGGEGREMSPSPFVRRVRLRRGSAILCVKLPLRELLEAR